MATGQQNINIGTGDNANDGDVLRAAFRKVRKMFAEIYGDTDAENLTGEQGVNIGYKILILLRRFRM